MKKQNLKNLALNKKSIAIISDNVKGGVGSFSDLLRCHLDPIETPLEPIPLPNSDYSVCLCDSFLC
ncbi:hypothetical protein H2O64_22785 [Kordia sp. YSTF-M3]|uniref:Uncharacterized protein n=1 Tax=Kordia aestuariivivens TaxID=2759037 RepID=A0ABR7QG08_9FLAO|nr:hypothetical protein [Kordia aestuariivivens]MBC8757514.1 hypothetical protein [Kordia aestuariivivens]